MIGFDRAVPDDGYAWWYIDGLSTDGTHGLTLIAFIGSVFSPYYAWARRRGPANPRNHCAINVALYRPDASAWSMTERPLADDQASPTRLAVGPSSLRWNGGVLEVSIDEWTVPWPSRLRGRVRLHCDSLLECDYALDDGARHLWRPLATRARLEVEFSHPALRWSGVGYFDSNRGSEPLERGVARWDWSRAHAADGSTAIVYDIDRIHGGTRTIAVRVDPQSVVQAFEPPQPAPLARSGWGLTRRTRCSPDAAARIVRSFEDGPFYSRALVATHWEGAAVQTVHETVSLTRFSRRWVQCLLPFRMPRVPGRRHATLAHNKTP